MADPIKRADALVDRDPLPAPHVRQRLRLAAGLTQAEVAEAVGVKRLAVIRWELGKTTPQRRHRETYRHLPQRLAEKHPEALEEAAPAATSPEQEDSMT